MRHKIMDWFSRNRVIFIAFGAAFGIMLLLLKLFGAYPLGPFHMLQIDASQEYGPRLMELFQKIKSGESLFYSWQGGLGNDYYFAFLTTMLNPFIYIGLLLAPTSITEVFTFMYLFQIPCCALTCAFFLKEKYQGKSWMIVMFSLMYAFSSYVTGYFWVYYWLTGVMVLPLVAVGIDRVLRGGKLTMYALSLGFGIISNYMMGLFLCMFSVLYFLGHVIMANDFKALFTIKRKTTLLPYIIGSLLAGGLAAFVIIPIVFSLPNTSFQVVGTQPLGYSLLTYFSPISFLPAHYFRMKPTYVEGGVGLPNVYMGLLGFIFAVFYFVNPKFTRKQKIVHGSILLILFLFFTVEWLDYIIHGFHYTSGAPHRFAFVYVFFLVYLAYESFENLRTLTTWRLVVSFLGFSLVSLFLFYRYPMVRALKPGVFSVPTTVANITMLVFYWFPIYRLNKKYKPRVRKNTGRIAPIILMFLLALELSINTFGNINYYKQVPERETYAIKLYDDMQKLISKTKQEPFYRLEQIPIRALSDGKMFGYNGLSIFSIAYNPVIDLLRKFGINASVNKVEYRLSTPLLNSIFAVKYSINREYMQPYPPTYFKQVDTSNSLTLMENPYALPVGFMVDDALLSWPAHGMINSLEFQNQFARTATAIEDPLFSEPIPIDEIEDEKLIHLETDPFIYEYALDADITIEDEPNIRFSFTAEEAGDYFLHIYGTEISSYIIELDDGEDYFIPRGFSDNSSETMDINNVPAGAKVYVTINISNKATEKDPEDFVAGYSGRADFMNQLQNLVQENQAPSYLTRQKGRINIFLTKLDPDAYQKTYDALADETLQLTDFDETHMNGSITVNKDGLLFTSIPYDTRWHVYVDGQEQEVLRVMDALVGVNLTQGMHNVELRYIPQGITLSTIISLGSLAAILLTGFLRLRKPPTEPDPVTPPASETEKQSVLAGHAVR